MVAARRDELRASLETWVSDRRLPGVDDNLKTVVTWVDLCSPRSATPERLLLAARDLLVVFFSLDDCSGEECEWYLDRCERILNTGDHLETSSPLLDAYRDTIAEISACGGDASFYKQGKLDLIAHYRWRAAFRECSSGLTVDEYLSHRRVTIYTRQWIDIWELLADCHISEGERNSEVVRSAVSEMVDWQFLQNDLVSVERDIRKGEPNIVTLLRHQEGCGLDEAKRVVVAMRDSCRSRLDDALERLRKWAGEAPRLLRYAEILDDCLRGTIDNYRENLVRYEIDETLGI